MIRRHFSVFLFLTYSLLGLAFLSWSADSAIQVLRYTFRYIVSPWVEPPLAGMDHLGDFGRNMSRLVNQDRTYREIESKGLLEKLDRLRAETVEEENRRLTRLLDLDPLPRFRPLVARVWARETAGGFHSLIIRRGEKDGIRPADPVVVLVGERQAVVGQVAEVFPETARVSLVTDPSSALSASVPRTGEQGVAEGAGARIVLNYLFSDTAVRTGDEVVTAGLGEIFPAGLWVGTVEGVETGGKESFRRAAVRPAARVGSLAEVLVLKRDAPAGDRP